MGIKDLFDHGTSIVTLKSGSLKDSFAPVESHKNIEQVIEKQNRFIPPVNFLTTSNFAKFGSAELYYDTAIKRIYGNYPYDGTAADKNKFDNSSLYIDKYIFDYLYPRSTGYAIFSADGWGSRTAITSDGYATPSSLEYIQFRGGPHTASYGMKGLRTSFSASNVYDANIYDNEGLPADFGKGTRSSNLRFTGSDGATVEFWLKKPTFDTTNNTHREVIFDLWNNQTSSGHSGSLCYGRMMIELDGTSTSSPFMITLMSGTSGFQHRPIGNLANTSSIADWGHYAFTFLQSGSYLKTKFYVNGGLNEELDTELLIGGFEHGEMNARIGALITGPTGSAAPAHSGKFSGSLDDFRYWKAARSSKQISDFYYVGVNGGTNTDIANATLGVYYKFNEGITGTGSTDSIVLDYSGRVSNGAWVGYGSNSRNTGSAIVEASASNSEFRDPIVHPNHTEVTVLHQNLLISGSYHDHQNNAMLYNTIPSWITDEADEDGAPDLKHLCHILGTYLDKLYLQIESLSAFNNTQYLSASYKAFPFYKNAIEGKGLETPELFIEADILEKFAQRTDTYNFNLDLSEVKNLIYQNIHSNLINIYKAKGTEKALRNVMRTFGIGDDLIKLNLYANNAKYTLQDNIHSQLIKKKYLNFSKKGNSGAVVYQTTEADNPNSNEFISGSKGDMYEKTLGFTLEANVMFPKYFMEETDDFYDRNWLTSSLFGMHRADHTASADITTWAPSGSDFANFQVQFIRNHPRSRSGHFRISSSNSPYPIPLMTSSVFYEVYDDDNWLVSFTVEPKRYRELSVVSGASHLDVSGYNAIFSGYHKVLGTTVDSFYLTQSMETTASRDFLKSDKRIFAGAYRDNMTGTLLYRNDTKLTEMRYWAYSLEPEEIERHAVDIDNTGMLNPYRIIGNLDPNFDDMEVRKIDSLALHWNFNSITSSDASGELIVQDASSGSYEKRGRLGIFGKYSGHQHTGKGKYFTTSSKEAIAYEFINNAKFRHYEQIVSSDMINILESDDHVFGSNQRPTNYHFTIEKSMYDVISQEILNMFAGIVDFNNLIGEPVNRYRSEYKNLNKLRTIFFERVGTTPDINRYLDFYKWFDDALSLIIRQLVPATADISDDLYNVVEEHALERNKYKTPFPTMDFNAPDPEAFIRGIEELEYSWKFGHSPLPSSQRPQHQKGLYWASRAEKDGLELTIKSASLGPYTTAATSIYNNSLAIDIGRKEIRDIMHSNPHFSQSLPILAQLDGTTYEGNAHAIRTFAKTYKFRVTNPVESSFKGGVNFSPGKSMEKVYNAVNPHGPIEAHGSKGGVGCGGCKLPVNILFARSEDFEPYKDLYDPLPPHAKVKKKMKVIHGRDSNKEALGYAVAKSAFFFPMNIISGTIDPDMLVNSRATEDSASHLVTANNAYEREISGNITNIHNDVYGRHMEKPMQGPFTEYAVGGHQSRHIELNTGSWTSGYSHQLNRSEAWRIHIGRCADDTYPDTDQGKTAVGIVGPDYPPPDLKLSATGNHQVSDVYPYIKHPRASYYRDGTAKRPVNIGNIHHTTGSPTILGNFNKRYDYVQTVGRYAQRRYLKDTVDHDITKNGESLWYHTQSILPERFVRAEPSARGGEYFPTPTTASTYYYQTTNVHTLISVGTGSHGGNQPGGFGNVFGGMEQSRLGGATNTSNRHGVMTADVDGTIFAVPDRRRREGIFTSRFSAPGGPEVLSPGYLDIHTGEFSVYNSLNFRNFTVRSSGSGEAIGATVVFSDNAADKATGFKSIRMHNHMSTGSEDERLQIRQGLRTLLTRHAGKAYSEAQYGYVPETSYIDEDDKAPASYHKIYRNKLRQLRDIRTENAVAASIITGSWFDNYWVQHTIPRSDLNYSWITGSILHDGFMPSTHGTFGYLPHIMSDEGMGIMAYWLSGFVSASGFAVAAADPKPGKMLAEGPWGSGSAYKMPYNFITASEYVAYNETGAVGGHFRLGLDKNTYTADTLNHLFVDFAGLNHIIVENISSSTAQLGFPIDHNTGSDGRAYHGASADFPQNPPYINDLLIDIQLNTAHRFGVTPLLNMLILHRQGPYGWPSWKQTRGTSHPIMRFERDRNILRSPTRALSASAFPGLQKRYYIQPVTSKYKAVQADIAHPSYTPVDYDSTDIEPYARFYATNYNQIVALQSDERNAEFFCHPDASNTWWDSLASSLAEDAAVTYPILPGDPAAGEFVAKVIYSESVWPSSLMAYMSSSRGRVGYSDRTWRAIPSERTTLGESRRNSKDRIHHLVHGPRFNYSSGSRLTQSSWPLDAHTDFLTRRGGPGYTGTSGTLGSGGIGDAPRILHQYHLAAVTGTANIVEFGGTRGATYDGGSGSHFDGMSATRATGAYNDSGRAYTPTATDSDMNGFGFITGGYHNGEGELQNSYTMFHGGPSALSGSTTRTGCASGPPCSTYPALLQTSPTALYSRKHTLASYRSVVGPNGIDIPETASNEVVAHLSFTSSQSGSIGAVQAFRKTFWGNIDLFGGEAAWEAPKQAGFLSQSVDEFGTITEYWVSASSLPWYDKYEDYILDPRAVAKDYTIVPEYSSKRWVSSASFDVPFTDPMNTPWWHTLEIITGGTTGSYNEVLDNNPENVVFKVIRGDNLRDLAGVQENLNEANFLSEHMGVGRLILKMEAIVKFLPYEGFYPAQRTLQLTEQFWKSHGSQVHTHHHPAEPHPGGGITGGGEGLPAQETFAIGGDTYMVGEYPYPIFGAGNTRRGRPMYSFRTEAYVKYEQSSLAWAASLTPSGHAAGHGAVGWTDYSGSESLLHGKDLARPLMQTLFSPGILYNSIKSGLAVDYPICVSESFERVNIGTRVNADTHGNTDYWAISGSRGTEADSTYGLFDKRIPFEAIINPVGAGGPFDGFAPIDMEPHPSAALQHTYTTLVPSSFGEASLYSRMASNFFAGTANFFLTNGKYTHRQSPVIVDVPVSSGSIYAMRMKLYRSMSKHRDYQNSPKMNNIHEIDSDSFAERGLTGVGWSPFGPTSSVTGHTYPLPQDPIASGTFPGYEHPDTSVLPKFRGGWPGDPELKETFTMYSRPSAFGPPLLGRYPAPQYNTAGGATNFQAHLFSEGTQNPWQAESSGAMDCINGYNWAFTPGYYHGESWVDIVYKPSASAPVSLEQIFNSTHTYVKHWRVDPGPTGSINHRGGALQQTHMIVHDPITVSSSLASSGQYYAGNNINNNAMQMTASFNIFNILDRSDYTYGVSSMGILAPLPSGPAAQSWVIQPKFETPMLNFNDQYSPRPLKGALTTNVPEGSAISIPVYASESVPRGMWHQFGALPQHDDQGIFFSIEDIKQTWLRSHPYVISSEPTIYNKGAAGDDRPDLYLRYRSLADLIGLDKGASRLGEMPTTKTVSEAIVAIPYYLDGDTKRFFNLNIGRKQIKEYRVKRHYAENLTIDELNLITIGPSGRPLGPGPLYLFDKMERFVFPPQLDFLRYPELVLGTPPADPTVPWADGRGPKIMYVFEFDHEFDKDDLSYMWQNLAPRDYKSYKKITRVLSHDMLGRGMPDPGGPEFLSRDDFLDFTKDIRWMVFKVKQRGVQNYSDVLLGRKHWRGDDETVDISPATTFGPETADGGWYDLIAPDIDDPLAKFPDKSYTVEHNWPYDYFSLVEQAKLTIDVEFRPVATAGGYPTLPYASDERWDPLFSDPPPPAPPMEATTTGPDLPEDPGYTADPLPDSGVLYATEIRIIDPDDSPF